MPNPDAMPITWPHGGSSGTSFMIEREIFGQRSQTTIPIRLNTTQSIAQPSFGWPKNGNGGLPV
ncbi:hypothetical protein Q0O76_14005, partial [Staphylococcus aureus]|nr:hypothetical protein [Staphylococcus aureus]